MHLGSEHCLVLMVGPRWHVLGRCELIKGPLRYVNHGAIGGLLLDGDDHLAVRFSFSHYRGYTSLVLLFVAWSMRRRVQVGLPLRLVLHLELGEECLLKFSLL